MEFQVPQFIEEKPKIVGFLTLAQFLYLAGAALISFVGFRILSFFLWALITLVVGAAAVLLAFVKINGQGFPKLLASAFNYFWGPRTYTWQRKSSETTVDLEKIEAIENTRKRMNIQEKLKSVALSVTTGRFFLKQPESEEKNRYETVVYLTGERKQAKRIDYSS